MTETQFHESVSRDIRAMVAYWSDEHERVSVVPPYPADAPAVYPLPPEHERCPYCHGTGRVEPVSWSPGRPYLNALQVCWPCNGEGRK
jgi:hypothetical protein